MNKEFSDQYKHPKWQKKRLEALESAEFACQKCYDSESQLHVHHKQYIKGRKVWEYETSELAVLCEGCHQDAHRDKDLLSELLMSIHPEGLSEVITMISAYCSEICGPAGVDASRILEEINDPYTQAIGSTAAKIANCFTSIEDLFAFMERLDAARKDGGVDVVLHVQKKHQRAHMED